MIQKLKSINKYILATLIVFTAVLVKAQEISERGNLPNYYHNKLNFGFALGVNSANFVIEQTNHFEQFDSLKTIQSKSKSGFNLGIIAELRLHKYLMLRFVPNLSFSERNLEYYFEGKDTIKRVKNVESTFLNFPLDLKLRSKRVGNFDAYLLAGGGYTLDLASKSKTENSININEQIVKLKKNDFFYEFGAGAEFYLQYFKFAIEGKMSFGTSNLLIKDNTIFSNSIDKLKSKVFLISITFEG